MRLIRMGEMAPKVLITDLGVTGLDFFRMINALITHARGRAMLVVVLVASEADKVGVRQRLPDEVVIVGTPLDSSELTVMVRAFLRNWRRENERTGKVWRRGGDGVVHAGARECPGAGGNGCKARSAMGVDRSGRIERGAVRCGGGPAWRCWRWRCCEWIAVALLAGSVTPVATGARWVRPRPGCRCAAGSGIGAAASGRARHAVREVLPVWSGQVAQARQQTEETITALSNRFAGISTRVETAVALRRGERAARIWWRCST